MVRVLLPLIAVVALSAAPASAKPPALAKAVLVECAPALDRSAREAVFEGRMRGVPGAARLQMRFTLETLSEGVEAWEPVTASGFGEWKSADPGVRRYVLTKAVANLAAPAAYRVTVRFRWLDLAGRPLLRRKLVSPACRQPDLRPDLRVSRIDVSPGIAGGEARYTVGVRNTGRTSSGAFELVLNVDGSDRPAATVPVLSGGERATVAFTGPPCSRDSVLVATADAGTVVDEAMESNNVFGRVCPFSG